MPNKLQQRYPPAPPATRARFYPRRAGVSLDVTGCCLHCLPCLFWWFGWFFLRRPLLCAPFISPIPLSLTHTLISAPSLPFLHTHTHTTLISIFSPFKRKEPWIEIDSSVKAPSYTGTLPTCDAASTGAIVFHTDVESLKGCTGYLFCAAHNMLVTLLIHCFHVISATSGLC